MQHCHLCAATELAWALPIPATHRHRMFASRETVSALPREAGSESWKGGLKYIATFIMTPCGARRDSYSELRRRQSGAEPHTFLDEDVLVVCAICQRPLRRVIRPRGRRRVRHHGLDRLHRLPAGPTKQAHMFPFPDRCASPARGTVVCEGV